MLQSQRKVWYTESNPDCAGVRRGVLTCRAKVIQHLIRPYLCIDGFYCDCHLERGTMGTEERARMGNLSVMDEESENFGLDRAC